MARKKRVSIFNSTYCSCSRYLKKTEENKAKNDKERLDGYYKRNYRDYFGFVEGSLKQKKEGELTESEQGILNWLEKNK
ncbi:uncharacterized protein LOC132068125 isoform X2 [Lycium ferocissimum]|uniref:uncharacterized protein LOC132068125 isoform X2 n=1 Tax=Lycium ferocissimum TaxID=112874 RepID=UPI002815AB60|nr:uncharacterized protein LOC132068125 isoform X2 [Lycium ferocissimum]